MLMRLSYSQGKLPLISNGAGRGYPSAGCSALPDIDPDANA
jgi:hypothetical protein